MPGVRDRFTEAEYQAAVAATEHEEGAAEHAKLIMNRPQASIEHHGLARLWVVSVALRETVQSCRAELRAWLLQEGRSAAELNADQERWQELDAQKERAKASRDALIDNSSRAEPNTPLQIDSRAIVGALRALLFLMRLQLNGRRYAVRNLSSTGW